MYTDMKLLLNRSRRSIVSRERDFKRLRKTHFFFSEIRRNSGNAVPLVSMSDCTALFQMQIEGILPIWLINALFLIIVECP